MMWTHLERRALVLLCVVVQQLDVPRLEQKLHFQGSVLSEGAEQLQSLLLLLCQPRNKFMSLRQLIVGPRVHHRQEALHGRDFPNNNADSLLLKKDLLDVASLPPAKLSTNTASGSQARGFLGACSRAISCCNYAQIDLSSSTLIVRAPPSPERMCPFPFHFVHSILQHSTIMGP